MNDKEFAMIEATLPAMLGGWKNAPDNFYGLYGTGYRYADRGKLPLISAICYNLYHEVGANPFLYKAVKTFYSERRGTIGDEFNEIALCEQNEQNHENYVKFVRSLFESCFDTNFMLEQLVPGKTPEEILALPVEQQSLITFCDSMLGKINEELTVGEKRNALRYLFVRYGFFTQR